MKRSTGILFIMIILSVQACRFEKANQNPELQTFEHADVPQHFVMLNQEEISPEELTKMRQSALAVLNHRQSENNKKSYTIVDKDLWKFDGVVKNSDFIKGEALAGKWIDFKEDLNYAYGDYGDQKGSGRYFFDLETMKLLLVDDHPGIKPQEFDVKLNNDMIVIVGAFLYQDNNLQAKLVRIPERPAKQAN